MNSDILEQIDLSYDQEENFNCLDLSDLRIPNFNIFVYALKETGAYKPTDSSNFVENMPLNTINLTNLRLTQKDLEYLYFLFFSLFFIFYFIFINFIFILFYFILYFFF